MTGSAQQTIFSLDCGATNWRLCRVEYRLTTGSAQILGEPQVTSMTSFVDRRLPAVICLNAEGNTIESIGEVAQQQLEDEHARERVREHFKPCIGAHLEKNPQPHQKRYTHTQALEYTRMLLGVVLEQIRHEKWRSAAFDDRVCFSFAYPVHWRHDHDGKVFNEFARTVRECFAVDFEGIRFVAEPEAAILRLQHQGLLGRVTTEAVTLIIDVGGSTTDIVAGKVDLKTGRLNFLGRYGEAFGGDLYDAELAKFIADELKVPASALADDPSALMSLRVSGQHLKESLSRQLLQAGQLSYVPQRTVTLVMGDGGIFRRTVALDEARFREITGPLDKHFQTLIEQALSVTGVRETEIGQVVLVGGGAQLFTIIGHLRERFGDPKVLLADNPEEIVAQGIGLEYGASMEKIEPTIQFPAKAARKKVPIEKTPLEEKSGWRLVSSEKVEVRLPAGVTRIGRGEDNDLQLDDLKASRYHAELQVTDETLIVVDLGSTNGTFVDGRRIPSNQPQALQAGSEIILGKTKFMCNHS